MAHRWHSTPPDTSPSSPFVVGCVRVPCARDDVQAGGTSASGGDDDALSPCDLESS